MIGNAQLFEDGCPLRFFSSADNSAIMCRMRESQLYCAISFSIPWPLISYVGLISKSYSSRNVIHFTLLPLGSVWVRISFTTLVRTWEIMSESGCKIRTPSRHALEHSLAYPGCYISMEHLSMFCYRKQWVSHFPHDSFVTTPRPGSNLKQMRIWENIWRNSGFPTQVLQKFPSLYLQKTVPL